MNDLERYLNAATRGLWGHKRRELRAELAGHIAVRVQEFRLGGLSLPEAERQTLRELGAPVQVSRGMAGVHTAPLLTQTGLGLTLAAALLTLAVPQGLAQVQVFDKDPPGFAMNPPYLNLSSLAAELRRLGARAEMSGKQLRLGVGGAPVTLGLFPGNSGSYGKDTVIERKDGLYLRSDELVRALVDSGLPVSLSGLTQPALQVGKFTLKLGTVSQPFDARALLEQRVWHDLSLKSGLNNHGYWTDFRNAPYRLSGLEPNGMYALATVDGPRSAEIKGLKARGSGAFKNSNFSLVFQPSAVLKLAQADSDGHISFPVPNGNFRLGDDPAALNLATMPEGPLPAVLLKLNRRLDAAGGPSYTVALASSVQAGP